MNHVFRCRLGTLCPAHQREWLAGGIEEEPTSVTTDGIFPLSPKSFLQSHPPCFSADSLYASPEAGPSYSLRQQVDCCICPRALFNSIPGHCPQSCEWEASTSGRRIRKSAKKIFLEVACKSTPSHRPSSLFHYTLVGEISIVSVPGSQSSSIPRWFLS